MQKENYEQDSQEAYNWEGDEAYQEEASETFWENQGEEFVLMILVFPKKLTATKQFDMSMKVKSCVVCDSNRVIGLRRVNKDNPNN